MIKILTIIYVVLSLVAIAVLTYFLVTCMNKEKFCNCFKAKNSVCPNRELLQKLYEDGSLTEYTDFAAIQNALGGPKWSDDLNDY